MNYSNGTPIVISDLLIGGTHNGERIEHVYYEQSHHLSMFKKIDNMPIFGSPVGPVGPVIRDIEIYERRTARYCWDAALVDHFVISGMSDKDATALLQEHR